MKLEKVKSNDSESNDGVEREQEEIRLRRSSRPSRPSLRLRDFITYEVHYPIQSYISYDKVSKCHNVFLKSIDEMNGPNIFEETKQHKVWNKAMDEELKALEKK
jgi:hypothetical protein